jgi:hypothetical protein
MQSRRVGDGRDIGLLVVALDGVQMDSSNLDFVARQPPQSYFASFGQARESAAALALRPFQQRVVTAADDGWRGDVGKRRRRDQAGRHPAIERGAWKQPAPP